MSKQIALKHFFVQQHYLVTVMISAMIHLNKRKQITGCFKVKLIYTVPQARQLFQSIFSYFHHPGAGLGFLSCRLHFQVFSWLSYPLPKTAMKILRKQKRRKGEDGKVYFHWFSTNVARVRFPDRRSYVG